VGGVRRDIPGETLDRMVSDLSCFERDLKELAHVFLRDESIIARTRGVGVLSRDDAYYMGAMGPTARGSGVAIDLRETGYAAYGKMNFRPVVEMDGDCYSRCAVRMKEVIASVDLIRQAAGKIPEGEIEVKPKGNPDGECFSRAEQPRGELVHYIKGDGSRHLVRSRIRTPTLTNLPPLVKMLGGCELADVPVIVLSIDPCIGCMER
jgi:Ni,Fe-hydrogenase III large subunit